MIEISTAGSSDELRRVYREKYGADREEYQKDMLQWMEFELLNEEYEKQFGDRIGTMMVSVNDELNAEIRECLRTGKPYDYGVPEDAIF